MKWTNERPTKPGWYLYRNNRTLSVWHIRKRTELWAYQPRRFFDAGSGVRLANFEDGQWAGPLDKPEG